MKLMLRLSILHFLLSCATQALGVTIQSEPAFDGEGFIDTELDKTVSLICQTENSSDIVSDTELIWLRNHALVSLLEGNKQGSSAVCVTPVTHEDNGANFTCHPAGNESISASVILNVTFYPGPSGTEEVAVEEDGSFVLSCDIWANPPVSSVSWLLNGTTVNLLEGGFVITTDGYTTQLSTNSVERGLHEGTYKCVAVSPKYEEFSKMFEVTVNEKTLSFPLLPIMAGLVVVFCTLLLAAISRRKKIAKCCKGACPK